MSAAQNKFDVIIVGGGPVGLSLAASLVQFGPDVRVAICDRRAFAVPNDGRASALAAGVTKVFEGLGIWPTLLPHASQIAHMRITDSGTGDISRPLFLSFDGDVVPGRPYAHMVPNQVTIGALLDLVTDRITMFGEVTIESVVRDNASATVTLADGIALMAPLVIAADGARSSLRDGAGIGVIKHDYGQMGLVTTISHEIDHENTAYEHFRPQGPFASLPLPNQRSSLVWTEKTADALELKELPKEELSLKIQDAMGSVLGAVVVEQPVQAFPLQMQIAREFVVPRMALIGDAAHVVHPIAGQGLNLGIQDVAVLAEVIIDALRLGQDIGSINVLERYQSWRRFDTALMAMTTDSLNRLFSNDIAPVRALRDLGMGVVDRMPAVKSGLIKHAAGLSGQGPKLMQGLPI